MSHQELTTARQPTQQKRKRTEQDPDNDHHSDSSLDLDTDTDSQSSSPEELSTSKKPHPPSASSLVTSPPPRKKSTKQAALCRVFKTTGKCKFGEKCRYRHALPESKRMRGKEKKGVKSLYQRVCYFIVVEDGAVLMGDSYSIRTERRRTKLLSALSDICLRGGC